MLKAKIFNVDQGGAHIPLTLFHSPPFSPIVAYISPFWLSVQLLFCHIILQYHIELHYLQWSAPLVFWSIVSIKYHPSLSVYTLPIINMLCIVDAWRPGGKNLNRNHSKITQRKKIYAPEVIAYNIHVLFVAWGRRWVVYPSWITCMSIWMYR